MEVDSIQSQPTSAGVTMRPSSTSASASSSAAHSADRDRRQKNIIIYNLPEATDHAADKVSFLALCKTVFNLDVLVTRVIRLGKRQENKHRPLLVCFTHKDEKTTVISRSNLLHRHDKFKRVFIAPDQTKFEREKHAKLVNELRERKTKGETNLIIRNGCIITRPSHPASNPPSQEIDHSSQSS